MRQILVLTFVCVISALLLSYVYIFTMPKIKEYKEKFFTSALSEIFPNMGGYVEVIKDSCYQILSENKEKVIGLFFRTSEKGYGGIIEMFVGIDTLERVCGLRIASPAEGLKETPGLGLKIREDKFKNQFLGKRIEQIRLKKEGGEIEAITAATISSKAVCDGIRKGIEKYKKYLREK
ncbi:MAG: FMN-binding protein [candidate division WOR-3 bacterium]|nr:FMN-binding protein [candidate division WOR-3 bacterium]MDW8114427.1 FMN-binding protein [candidate division WOR-3 bacterium]